MPAHSPRLIAGLAMLCLGFFDGVIGVAWLSIHQDLNVTLESLGWVLGAVGLGSALGSAIFPLLVRSVPHLNILALCLGIQASVFLLAMLTSSYWMFVSLYALRGISNGMAHAALNAFFAQRISPQHLMNIHGGWGIGTASAGFLTGILIAQDFGWEAVYLTGGALSLFGASVIFFTRHNFSSLRIESPSIDAEAFRATLPIMFSVVSGAAFVGLEQGVGHWMSTVLVAVDGTNLQQAGLATGLFWGGLTFGRFTLTRIPATVSQMLLWASGSVAVILCCLIVIPTHFKMIAYGAVGIAMAPMSAFILTAGARLVPVEKRDVMMAIQILSFSVGAAVIPAAFGGLASLTFIGILPFGFVVVSLLLITGIWITVKC